MSEVVTNLVDMMNGAMEYTIPPAHKMGIGVARSDLRAEATLDDEEIGRIEAEAGK